jgi:Deoxynucleotide monophosphate kinase
MLVIGLTGRKQSGKDMFCECLQTSAPSGLRVVRLAFADLLKGEVAKACGVTVEEINRDKAVFRPVLQWWGTDFRRQRYGEGYWVGQVRKALREWPDPTAVVCLTDVRFPNEAQLVRELGGVLLRLVRPQTETADSHPSEIAMDGYPVDQTVLNDGCLSALQEVAALFWAGGYRMHTQQHCSCSSKNTP